MKNLSERIVYLRTLLGLNQAQFAQKIGESPSKLSVIEKGATQPLYTFLENILNIFPNVNSEWLVKGAGQVFIDGVVPDVSSLPEKKKIKVVDEATEKLIARLELELNDAKSREKQLLEILAK